MRSKPRSSAGARPTAASDGSAEQLHALGADRSRLAADLDAQAARARKLETANREIARRLDVAMDNIRSVLDAQER